MSAAPALPTPITPRTQYSPRTGAETLNASRKVNHEGSIVQMSQSKNLERSSTHSFRTFFAAKWAQFLRENYRNPEAVAVCFGVRFQTALNWWNGDNAPSGYAVAMAFQNNPEAATRHLALTGTGNG